jgi:hypothetical protein
VKREATAREPATDGQRGASEATRRKLEALPPEIGALLVLIGILGLLLPGPVGTPFVIAGGVALWPKAFGKVDGWFERRFPKAHRGGMRQIDRYLADMEKRVPGTISRPSPAGPSSGG